jgi:L-threonylcarbamoyladenylate synthase
MKKISEGGIAVIPTDTIYGIVTSAWHKESVEQIYKLKQRTPQKPCIILLSSAEDMRDFGVADQHIKAVMQYPADRPTSFIVPITKTTLTYLDRGTGTLAFRIPKDPGLQAFLAQSGPIIAPSANIQDHPPATTIAEAREYFGDSVSQYIDGGTIIGKPSTLIDIVNGVVLR